MSPSTKMFKRVHSAEQEMPPVLEYYQNLKQHLIMSRWSESNIIPLNSSS